MSNFNNNNNNANSRNMPEPKSVKPVNNTYGSTRTTTKTIPRTGK